MLLNIYTIQVLKPSTLHIESPLLFIKILCILFQNPIWETKTLRHRRIKQISSRGILQAWHPVTLVPIAWVLLCLGPVFGNTY